MNAIPDRIMKLVVAPLIVVLRRAIEACPRSPALTLALIAIAALRLTSATAAEARHAIAMHGEPALGVDFKAFDYVQPDAPRGGRLVQGVLGTFDSLNPLIVKGLAVSSIRGYVIESLMTRGYDEPFTLYALIANTVETDAARSYVTFGLDPR